jgi:hypothetical protein
MHPISPNRVAISIVLAVGLVCWVSCATAQETDELPEILARVNGNPIYEKDIVPDESGIIHPLKVAVDHELIAQLAAKEGITVPDQTKSIRAMRETKWLSTIYQEKIRAEAEDKPVTEAEIDACLIERPDYFAKLNPDLHRQQARNLVIQQHKADAYGDWLRTLLANVRVTVNGDAIPAQLVEQAIETVTTTMRRDKVEAGRGTVLYDTISELVVAREAKAQGVEPATLAADAKRVNPLIAAAEMTVDGRKLLLENVPSWRHAVSQGANSATAVDYHLLIVIKEQVLAIEALQKNFDKAPEFKEQLAAQGYTWTGIASPSTGANTAVINAYYRKHNLTAADIEVTDGELEEYSLAVFEAVTGVDADAKDAVRRHLNSAKQKIAAADLTDDEWKSWQLHIALSFLNENRTTMRDRIAAAKLEWTRQAHIKELRDHADIEFLVDLD